MAMKVVIERRMLPGSNYSGDLQRVATVYIDADEYRVFAPGAARGDALEWVDQFLVRQSADDGFGGEYELSPHDEGYVEIKNRVEEELRKQNTGVHPDGTHCAAQICLKGHILHCDGESFESTAYCTKCGSACIDRCQRCNEPIRGAVQFQSANTYSRPRFCHACGRAYPWMSERLLTARELLNKDEKLTAQDRTELWDLLQDVMSNPTDELTPAKRKLLEINLGKATGYIKDTILDLTAKTIAEMIKG
jgi:hypothetical protein